jgi:hypothetical protein
MKKKHLFFFFFFFFAAIEPEADVDPKIQVMSCENT